MSPFPAWRLELFFKSSQQLRDQIPFLKEHNLTRLNLTNKSKDDNLMQPIHQLHEALGTSADVCVHWSVKFQYRRSPEGTLSHMRQFYKDLPSQGASVLLCSGGGKKKSIDSIEVLTGAPQPCTGKSEAIHQDVDIPDLTDSFPTEVLQDLSQDEPEQKQVVPTFACFNPYLPDSKDRQEERRRLKTKVQCSALCGIYLQMGSDLNLLEEGLRHLQSLIKESGHETAREIPIYGSVFIPSKRLLAQQKFRPWHGVFLSSEYLEDVEGAKRITVALLQTYKRFGVTPLVESAVKDTGALREVIDLFEQADKA